MPQRTCKNCLWRQPDPRPEYINHGFCRRSPPTVVAYSNGVDNFIENHWPWVDPSDWCGEWKYHVAHPTPDKPSEA